MNVARGIVVVRRIHCLACVVLRSQPAPQGGPSLPQLERMHQNAESSVGSQVTGDGTLTAEYAHSELSEPVARAVPGCSSWRIL